MLRHAVILSRRSARQLLSNMVSEKVDIRSKILVYGETYARKGALPTPTKPNAKFIGWIDENGNMITNDTVVATTKDQTLTAKWEYALPSLIDMELGSQCSLDLSDALTLKSSNENVVYVAPSQTLTAVGTGNAVLFVLENGEIIKQINVSVTNAPSQVQTLLGDVDCNSDVNVADAVLLARMLAEDKDVTVSAQGRANANVNGDDNVDSDDLTMILEILANISSAF